MCEYSHDSGADERCEALKEREVNDSEPKEKLLYTDRKCQAVAFWTTLKPPGLINRTALYAVDFAAALLMRPPACLLSPP